MKTNKQQTSLLKIPPTIMKNLWHDLNVFYFSEKSVPKIIMTRFKYIFWISNNIFSWRVLICNLFDRNHIIKIFTALWDIKIEKIMSISKRCSNISNSTLLEIVMMLMFKLSFASSIPHKAVIYQMIGKFVQLMYYWISCLK